MTLIQLFTRLVNRQQIPSESTRWWKSRSSTRRRGRQRLTGAAALESRVLLAGDMDDQISEAALVGLGQTQTGIIDVTTDVDMRAFTVVAGQTVAFDLDTQGLASPLTDSVLRLFNAAGTQLAVDDDTDGPAPEGNGFESFLSYTFATGGTYYIGVSAFSNTGYNATTGDGDLKGLHTGNYELHFSDPDDQISEAPLVGLDQTLSGIIDVGSDVDMFKFTVVAGQTVEFDLDTQGLEIGRAHV